MGEEIRRFRKKGSVKKDRLKYAPGSKVNPINVHPKELEYRTPRRNIEFGKSNFGRMKGVV